MKNIFGPWMVALFLVIGCALLRLVENLHPDFLPGATPCVALAFIGAIYFSPRWSWLLGAASIVLSEMSFLRWNFLSEGHWFSPMIFISLGFYVLMGIWGISLSRRTSLALLFGGPIAGSILFYILANTFAWWSSAGSSLYAYPQNFAGWVQANTTGWPGYAPAWTFLRNGIVADVVFTVILVAILDPARLSLASRSKAVARS